MEASCIFCGGVSTSLLKSPGLRRRPSESISLYRHKNLVFLASPISHRVWASANNSRSSSNSHSATKRRSRKNREYAGGSDVTNKNTNNKAAVSEQTRKKQLQVNDQENGPRSVRALYQNGDPLGRRELGKGVVKWICQGMKAMALDFATVEMQGDFAELKQRMGPGLTFVIQAQPYLNAVPMPLGLEAICLKTCTHYPTLFDHFQRELRDVLQDLQHKTLIHNWRETESWKLLKELASSAQHRAIARKTSLTKSVHGVLGLELVKAKAMQCRIDEFTKQMSDLLRIERDAELEFTQDELNAVPTPDDLSSSSKPIEFLVSHAQAEQELCDTICKLVPQMPLTSNSTFPTTTPWRLGSYTLEINGQDSRKERPVLIQWQSSLRDTKFSLEIGTPLHPQFRYQTKGKNMAASQAQQVLDKMPEKNPIDSRKVLDRIPVTNEKGECSTAPLLNTNVTEHVRIEENVVQAIVESDASQPLDIENHDNDVIVEVNAENDALIVDVIPENATIDEHAENEACFVVNENVEGVGAKEPHNDGVVSSGTVILRPDKFICDLMKRTVWIKVERALKLLKTFKQFGVVIKGIEENVEEVIKMNTLAIRSGILYQKCVLIFDRVSQLYIKPLDERSPPIATRTRRRKKGKNSLEPPDPSYF
ncbi:UNVERIFIED_CONTAM: hypothetical protein Sradi_6326400 [Sesamum radiatum]|uniref:Uncharacterized protein n=1 Tax=Sesamum radiatum TaxID=300843 RepID=A0AAW2KFH0_SESRA